MFVHIAVFRWKDHVTADEVTGALAIVKSLETQIPGVKGIYVGENYSKWNKGYTHAVVVIGGSQEAIDQYRAHPVHVDVAEAIDSMEADGIGIDFHDDNAT